MRPDILRRVAIMSALMCGWIVLSTLIIIGSYAIDIQYYVFAVILVLAAMIFSWAGLFQLSIGKSDAILSRRLILIFGTITAWALLMLVGAIAIGASFTDENDILNVAIAYSIFVNIVLLVMSLFLRVYLFQMNPGKYYLISYLGKPDHDFDIEYHPFERQLRPGETVKPGGLINRSRRMWIRAVDIACEIWDSQRKYQYSKELDRVTMQDNLVLKLTLKARFDFYPKQITSSKFALDLSKKSSILGVEDVLSKTLTPILEGALRNLYYDKPHDRADSPRLEAQLNEQIQQRVANFANTHGLVFNGGSAKVTIDGESPPEPIWKDMDNAFLQKEQARFNQLTIDAYQGDNISRYELYHYFVQYPELKHQFLPHVNNVTLGDIDHLLQNMNFDPAYRDEVVSEILKRNYYQSMLPPPEQIGAGEFAPQISPPLSDSQPMPPLEHPEFLLSCTARNTVMISWQKLSGEMYLNVDGQTMGPFRNAQDSHDTGRMSINEIEYTWQGQTYSIGNYTCGQPPPPPPNQTEVPPKKRRRYGPSGSAQ